MSLLLLFDPKRKEVSEAAIFFRTRLKDTIHSISLHLVFSEIFFFPTLFSCSAKLNAESDVTWAFSPASKNLRSHHVQEPDPLD